MPLHAVADHHTGPQRVSKEDTPAATVAALPVAPPTARDSQALQHPCCKPMRHDSVPLMPISKRDLVDDLLGAHPELTRKAATAFVTDLLSTITAGLKRGESVRFAGFGSFVVRDRPARTARVPGSDRTVAVSASRTVKFRPAAKLKAEVTKAAKKPRKG